MGGGGANFMAGGQAPRPMGGNMGPRGATSPMGGAGSAFGGGSPQHQGGNKGAGATGMQQQRPQMQKSNPNYSRSVIGDRTDRGLNRPQGKA